MSKRQRRRPQAFFLIGVLALCTWPGNANPLENPPVQGVPVPMDTYNFDREVAGQPPLGFTFAAAAGGKEPLWIVTPDRSAPSAPNILMLDTKNSPSDRAALAILNARTLPYGETAVRFKIVSGEGAQSAGLVWRYQDPRNYYVLVANSRDDACSVFRVKKGKVKSIDTQAAFISPHAWHELRIVFVKNKYTAFLDGEPVLGGKDSTFEEPGGIGLWTAPDASISFDQFRVSR